MGEASPGSRLRRLVATSAPVLAPGAANALGARIIADCGFDVVYATGAGISNWLLGAPDLGLVTMTEMAGQVARICEAVDLPVIADADTGYGNPLNVTRTVRMFERAGVAALQLEDQVEPKRCGHFDGKQVIPKADMVAKLKAAVDARRDASLVIIARTDARATEGLDAAIERAHAYRDAGADWCFIEAPQDEAELARVGREGPGPLVANMVENGKTPILPRARLGELGFSLILYANLAQRAAMQAMGEALAHLITQGVSDGLEGRLVTMDERNRLTGMSYWRGLEQKFRS